MRSLLVSAVILGAVYGTSLVAEEERESNERLAPGAALRLAGTDRSRRAEQIVYASDAAETGVRWHAFLQSQVPGNYRFAVLSRGEVELRLGNESILNTQSKELKWQTSEPIELDYDRHELEVSLRPVAESSRLTLFWSGPGFPFEPIPPQQLYHDPAEVLEEPNVRGHDLTRALRCDACHKIRGLPVQPLRSPALDPSAAFLREDWLVSFLSEPRHNEHETAALDPADLTATWRRLHGTFSPEEASDLAAYLRVQSSDSGPEEVLENDTGDASHGRELFLTLGCLACHQYRDMGRRDSFAGGDLSRIAEKRPDTFFHTWLSDPARINAQHRMPVFDLSAEERHDLSAFLATLENTPPHSARTPQASAGDPERGKALFRASRCAVCHSDEGTQAQGRLPNRLSLDATSNWSSGCLQGPTDERPGYRIHEESTRAAIQDFVSRQADTMPDQLLAAESRLRENNCLACHARHLATGLLPVAKEVVERHDEMAALLPALLPPSLNSVGDKLHDETLLQAIARRGQPHRDWLKVRMPRFPLDEHALRQIARYFRICDRVPEEASRVAPLVSAASAAAERLVTADGFGCTSCHAIGNSKPRNTPLGAQGADLSMLGRRIRRTWFDRWVRNPARIVPKMEMPAVQIAVPGVMDGDLDQQLAAVWDILNQPGFLPPDPNPVRTVRQTGLRRSGERAAVLTDVLKRQGNVLIKPFLIGLPNRHNVLLDLAAGGRLAGWWTGDTARQRTKGKTWYWEATGQDRVIHERTPELTLIRHSELLEPRRSGQFVTEADRWLHTEGGVQIDHRLRFGSSPEAIVPVSQRITPSDPSSRAGWRREIRVSNLGDGDAIRLRLANPIEGSGVVSVEVGTRSDDQTVAARPDASGVARLVLAYLVEEEPEPLVAAETDSLPTEAAEPVRILNAIPGFRVTRLGLPSDLMPTALAWTSEGSLLISSLKGRVWLAEDTTGDELEDRVRAISDELAAPYGMHATGDAIDVVNKFGVVRLYDLDGDDLCDLTEVVASGWGHTDDYHDWAVGLPADDEGNYYVAIPCQQDDRPREAARLRGTVVQLRPRVPTPASPRRFEVHEISRGHRFPMGMARNRGGQLFVTDNQGNYNPFNELNHVLPGAHFGFINKLDAHESSQRPPLAPPAINIPHPWTRSVNGICFLETPAAVRRKNGPLFGPLEGHLVGCEYDTRRLIRMSLQQVESTVQGAAYPLSEPQLASENMLLGPVACAISPQGVLYVGNLRDSGWGGANNTGSIVRVSAELENLPAGIAEVRAIRDGFEIEFTRPVLAEVAGQRQSYTIDSYRRISTPAYGGDDVDRRTEPIDRVVVSPDRRSVRLFLPALRAGYVYELRLKPLVAKGERFFPAEAYYTLRQLVP